VPVIVPVGEGRRLEARGSVMLFKATAATTGGRFSLMDRTVPPHGRPPAAHRHPLTVEAFLVLEGALTFIIDGQRTSVAAGGCVILSEGEAHTFVNEGDLPARTLIIHAPALDPYFEDLAALWSRAEDPTTAEELEVMRHHGLEPVD
jgi:quercetin dioxygenase-like cupin family protein